MRHALQLALDALEKKNGKWGEGHDKLNSTAIAAIKQALAEPEPFKHGHQWIRTGAMEPGECRCILCGEWSKTT